MNQLTPITAHVDAETLALVEQLAQSQGLSVAAFAAEAIQRVAESHADYQAFVQQGIDELDRGEGIPHEVIMAELDAMIAKHEGRCRD